MSYIGNGRTLVILGTNVRDDIVPTYKNPFKPDGTKKQYPEDGDFDQTEFTLSQEVPGGYEQNVLVLRQKYIVDELIQNTTTVNIVVTPLPDGGVADTFKIVCNNATVSSTLAIVREKMKFFSGSEHKITISGSSVAKNNNTFTVVDVAYSGNGTSVEITLNRIDIQTSTTGETLTFNYSYTSPWEVLNPESDYKIIGDNKIIQLKDPPQFNDQLYVVHRGEATYNLVPSPNSVGPDQLSHNLRNFVCDRYEGSVVGGIGVKTFALSQEVVNSKAILVTVDGVVKESDYDKYQNSAIVTVPGDWKLDDTLNGDGKQTITFASAPSAGAKIRILHLGFSTVSRREVLSPGQIGGLREDAVGTSNIRDGAVTTDKIANSAVTTSKLAGDSVIDTKILLDNNKSLRAKKTSGVATGLIKLDATDITTVEAETQTTVAINGTKKHNFTSTEIAPETTNEISLGTLAKRFKDLNLSGLATIGDSAKTTGTSLDVKGDIAVNGTVDGVDVSALKAVVDQLVTDLPNLINSAVPVGTMMMWTASNAPNEKWLPCDGRAINRQTYNTLFTTIQTTFGSGDGSTTFNLPDMRRRFAVGALSSSELGNNETPSKVETAQYPANARTLTHTHTGAAHTHDLSGHTHIVPGHNHAVDTAVSASSVDRFRTIDTGAHQTTIDITHGHASSTADNNTTSISYTVTAGASGVEGYIPAHSHKFIFRGGTAESSWNGMAINGGADGPGAKRRRRWSSGWTDMFGNIGSSSDYFIVSGSLEGAFDNGSRNHDNGSGNWRTYNLSGAPEGTNGYQNEYLGEAPSRTINGYPETAHAFAVGLTEVGNSGFVLSKDSHGHGLTKTDPGHGHNLTITELKGASASKSDSTTSGKHKHDYTDFSGKIGKLTTYIRTNANNTTSTITPSNGDGDFSTSGPSTDSTGDASYGSNVSGASVSPHLTVNYIIKVL